MLDCVLLTYGTSSDRRLEQDNCACACQELEATLRVR